ncbi:MAG TPA: SAM-dependent methyltransferase [Firmicutes bacterium]|jgi:23S rRNA (cytosine1962-C5)-methyltransferase|nr:SAM-dependent methyltransferase [Bacillota bacterium]
MFIADGWRDYELLDTGDGERLERWGKYILRRPDPQIIWPAKAGSDLWEGFHARYHRSSSGGGSWEIQSQLPERWVIHYRALSFYVKAMGFKHTGLFPEQAANWEWLIHQIHSQTGQANVLNLFAYTGGATVAAAHAGAAVCHIDAAKGMVSWAKENLILSEMAERPVRFIVDDVLKFVQREKRRNRQYEGIIMDPPSFGRGPNGEIWKIEDEIYNLVKECVEVLAPKPRFFLINSYTTGLAPTVLKNILSLTVGERFGGKVSAEEVGLPVSASSIVLPCGASGRWEAAE